MECQFIPHSLTVVFKLLRFPDHNTVSQHYTFIFFKNLHLIFGIQSLLKTKHNALKWTIILISILFQYILTYYKIICNVSKCSCSSAIELKTKSQ